MRKVTKEMEKKIVADRVFRNISYNDISTNYRISKSGISLIVKRFCGKVYSDFISSDNDYDYICQKYSLSKSSVKKILSEAERLYHIGLCHSRIRT